MVLKQRLKRLLTAFFIFASPTALGTTWTVSSSGGACTPAAPSCSTPSAAILAAAPGDTIFISEGTYTARLPVIRKNLTIRGAGMDKTFLDGQNLWQVLVMGGDPGLSLTLEDLTVRNGFTPSPSLNGAGLYVSFGGLAVINRCGFRNNTATNFGGGIFVRTNGQLTLNQCEFTDNVSARGGAVGLEQTVVAEVNGSLFSRNQANVTDAQKSGEGGGIAALDNVTLTASEDVFEENEGGGIVLDFGGTADLDSCRFTNNTRHGGFYISQGTHSATANVSHSEFIGNDSDKGGGIQAGATALTVRDSLILNNSVPDNSAGGRINASNRVTIERCLVAGNSAGTGGGIATGGQTTLINTTVSGNRAVVAAGGVEVSSSLKMDYCTIVNNTVTDPVDVRQAGSGVLYHPQFESSEVSHTIIANNIGGNNCRVNTVSTTTLLTSLGYNLSSDATCFDPAVNPTDQSNTDPLLGPLQDNGGPTFTHALLPGSPAIDVGPDTSSIETDQRGFPRLSDGDGDGIAHSDIGAFELLPNEPPPDETPPTVEQVGSGRLPDGRAYIDIQAQDPGSGLKEIIVVRAVNVEVTIPPFSPGTHDPVTIRVVQAVKGQTSSVTLRVTDMAGNIR